YRILFHLPSPVTPPNLPSFPTRRSSDLSVSAVHLITPTASVRPLPAAPHIGCASTRARERVCSNAIPPNHPELSRSRVKLPTWDRHCQVASAANQLRR